MSRQIEKNKENSPLAKSPKSPFVLKPKPLLRRKLKYSGVARPLVQVDTNVALPNNTNIGFLSQSPALSFNPFKCVLKKRKRSFEETENEDESLLSKPTNFRIFKNDNQFGLSTVTPDLLNEDAHLGFDDKHFSPNSNEQTNQSTIPVDWSLKTKIRLTSTKPFPWRTSFKTSEEASGTTAFVRCMFPEDTKDVYLKEDGKTNRNQTNPLRGVLSQHSVRDLCHLDSSHGAKLYKQCLVWMHPSLPWLNLFPRTDNQAISSSPLDTKYLDVLHSSWCDSFRSLYQLVRTCQCPYFYLCAPQFTVMFRSNGVGSICDIHAAISPTTKGLRNALIEEGIEFTMPLNASSSQNSFSSDDENSILVENKNKDVDNEGGNGGDSEDEEPGTWLESLGLSQQDFPSLNPMLQKRRQERQKSVDHRQESLVYVEGADTQALVNFLLNYPSCISKTGPMAGIPPTLLSPVAFLGATLQAHKVRHAKIMDKSNELFVVELSGPLLPNAVHSLCSLFNTTQSGTFSANLTPHQPTLAFARLAISSSTPAIFATENLKDCGLPSAFIKEMCAKKNEHNAKGIATIAAENGLFSWT